jgi:1-deoxy-D-xylulose-5-phosphate reductoisomerase
MISFSEETKKYRQRNVAIVGSTGSIGKQALEVISAQPHLLRAYMLVASNNAELLCQQAIQYKPDVVIILNPEAYHRVKDTLKNSGIKVLCGEEALLEEIVQSRVDIVLNAFVGFAGLRTTYHALRAGKTVALANKESLVVAGELLMPLSKQNQNSLLPVDSEHSAIFQCLMGEDIQQIEKIILTASGGPFRGMKRNQLLDVTPEKALKHPNWSMGAKITIDSATLMNKGLEVMEARWLFDVPADAIEVIIHPQSIIHSIVQFRDGSMKAQLGPPDMRFPIQFALCYPHRPENTFPRFDFSSSFHFEKPDTETFPCLGLAYEALRKGGNLPCILNAANEVAVDLFLKEKISFLQITELIEFSMHAVSFIPNPNLEDLIETDKETRRQVMEHTVK